MPERRPAAGTVRLDPGDAAELIEILSFLADWLDDSDSPPTSQDRCAGSPAAATASPISKPTSPASPSYSATTASDSSTAQNSNSHTSTGGAHHRRNTSQVGPTTSVTLGPVWVDTAKAAQATVHDTTHDTVHDTVHGPVHESGSARGHEPVLGVDEAVRRAGCWPITSGPRPRRSTVPRPQASGWRCLRRGRVRCPAVRPGPV